MKRRLRALLIAGGAAALVLSGWAFGWEPRQLVVRTVSLDLPCWPEDPLLVALVSDLHIGSPGVGLSRLDQIVAMVNAARPDVILLLGDFVIQGVAGGPLSRP